MNFKVGDLAVYPAQGIGMVQAIETKSISGGKKESFYVLRILDTGVTIMIPMGNVEQVGQDSPEQRCRNRPPAVEQALPPVHGQAQVRISFRNRRGVAEPSPSQGREGPLFRGEEDARHGALSPGQGDLDRQVRYGGSGGSGPAPLPETLTGSPSFCSSVPFGSRAGNSQSVRTHRVS
jgi:hypothetical protein